MQEQFIDPAVHGHEPIYLPFTLHILLVYLVWVRLKLLREGTRSPLVGG